MRAMGQPMVRYRQFCDKDPQYGKRSGQTLLFNKKSNASGTAIGGRIIGIGQPIPRGNFSTTQGAAAERPQPAGFHPEASRNGASVSAAPDADDGAIAKGLSFREAKEQLVGDFERRFLLDALRRNGGNITRAAEEVGMYRQSFQQKMRELGITPDDAA